MASQFETGGNPPAPATFDAVLPRRDTPSGGTPAARMLDEVLRDWTQQRPRAPLSSVVSADGLIDFGPHDQTMPVSFHQSTDDRDESAPASPQRTLDSMLGSSDAAVQADGRQLQGMLNGTPEQRDLATAIIDNLSTNEARHRMLGILNDPQRREAAGQLSRMLRTPGDQFAAGELLDMLGSNNQTEQQDGRRLLDMLNNREQQALAQRLMGGLSVEGSARHQFLDMLNNPQQRQAAQEIAALLTSDDPLRTRAGATLINDLAGPGQTGRQDAERLMGMLRQEGTRDNALAILGNLSSPEQRHRMLEIMGNPENQGEHGASQRLLAMLRSDERQDGAAALLDLMNSRFPSEQQDGRRLLSMLNGGPQQQAMAERLLNIEDVERRHQLVNLAGNPRTAGAADALLQMRASRNRREGNAADRVLDLLESDSQADNRYGRDLAGLLSDPRRRGLVEPMLRLLNDSQAQQMMQILNDPQRQPLAEQLATMLGGTNRQHDALSNFLNLRANNGRPEFVNDLNRLTDMLTDPQRRDTAQLLLSQLPRQNQLHEMLQLTNDPNQARASEQIMQMLRSDNPSETASARNLLDMLAAPPSPRGSRGEPEEQPERADAQQIIRMLNNPQDQQTARQMLQSTTSAQSLHTLLRMHNVPGYRQDAQALMSMIANPRSAQDGRAILSQLSNPSEIHQMLGIMNNPDQTRARQNILQMLQSGDRRETGAVSNLLNGLGRSGPEGSAHAQQLLAMLNDSARDSDARQIMGAASSPAELQQLTAMIADPARRAGARELSRLLGSESASTRAGAGSLMEMLRSPDETTRRGGRQLLDMLSNQQQHEDGARIISGLQTPQQFQAILAIMNNPQQRGAARELLGLLGSGNESTQRAVRDVLSSGNNPNSQHLLSMLNDQMQAPAARTIMTRLETPEQRNQMLSILYTQGQQEAAHQLLSMLGNGSSTEQRNVAAFLQARAASEAAVRPVFDMLNRPQSQQTARRLFAQLPDQQQLQTMAGLLNDPRRRPAADQLMEMLGSNDPAQRQGVRNLLDLIRTERAFPGRPGVRSERNGENLLDGLGDPQRRDRAREIMTQTGSARQLGLLLNMQADGTQAQTSQALMAMLRDPERRQTGQAMLENLFSADNISRFMQVINNPQNAEASQHLLSMLNSDEQRRDLFSFLNIMRGNEQAGQQLLSMLNNPDSRVYERALHIMESGLDAAGTARLLGILNNPQQSRAADTLMGMLRPGDDSEPFVVRGLLNLLGGNAAERAEGERFLSMLNSSRRDYTALRILRDRLSRSFGKTKG